MNCCVVLGYSLCCVVCEFCCFKQKTAYEVRISDWSSYVCSSDLLIGFNSIPKVAVVPVLVIWFGIGTIPAIITAFIISFFPIVVNVATGLATIEPELRDVLRSLGATKTEILMKIGRGHV